MRSENIIFKKVINFGTVKNIGNIFCEIRIRDNGEYKELSISGVEGPRKSGNCRGSCGQINDTIVEHIKRDEFNKFADGWDKKSILHFIEVWKTWHLNGMKAGNAKQEAFVKKYLEENPTERYDYTKMCKLLEEHNLFEDKDDIYNGKPYKYGHGWRYVALPEEVIDYVKSLPETKIIPAWV